MVFKKEAPTIEISPVGDDRIRPASKKDFKNILIRIPSVLLVGLDLLLDEKPWLNRTQWIVEAIHEKLTHDIKDE